MKASEQNLTANQERAIIALLNETTQKAAAESVGVSEVTLHRWLKLKNFDEAYRAARREAVTSPVASGLERGEFL